MKFQEYICDETKKAAAEAFRYAKSVPAEKVEWSPMEAGRTVLDQARELAKCPVWAYLIVSGGDMPAWDEESAAKSKAEMAAWKTVEDCEAECNKQLDKLFELYKSIPDEKLSDTKFLPFDGGRDFAWTEMMDYPRWNFNYHTGQIAFIQTLFGDKDMH